MTPKILAALEKRSKLSKKYYANSSMINIRSSYTQIRNIDVFDAKDHFLNRLRVKLDDPNTSAKSYWSIINNFLNNRNISTKPPPFLNGTVILDFK